MLRFTSTMGSLTIRPPGGSLAANSLRPDVEGHRASRLTDCGISRGNWLIRSPRSARGARIGGNRQRLPPESGDGTVVAVRVPVTGNAGRGRSTRAGYLAEAQHQKLPASRRHPQKANTVIRRGPGQQPEFITGELTITIPRPPAGDDLARRLRPHPTRPAMADWQALITRNGRFSLV